MNYFSFVFLLSLPFIAQSEFTPLRPTNGIGSLLISSDTDQKAYNEARLMVIFDLDCLEDNSSSSSTIVSQLQQTKLSSILTTFTSCLQDIDLSFQLSGTGYALSFLDIEGDGSCLDGPSILNYDSLCIYAFTYEPIFFQNSSGGTYAYETKTSDDYTCSEQSTRSSDLPSGSAWGLDQLDSKQRDNSYQYPNTEIDNGVDFYILDEGVLDTHDEFVNNKVYHMLGDGPDTYASEGWYASHGTHVAATSAGLNYGVSKNLNIYDYRVCEYVDEPSSDRSTACYSSQILSALRNITDELGVGGRNSGRRGVINMSLGGSQSFFSIVYEYYFTQIKLLGGIIVVAAGNSDDDACDYTPAYSTDAITVGAANDDLEKASFSNYGDCVDIWAPGQSIVSALADCDSCYESWSGTSMASPHIAGMVANMLWVDPTLSFDEIKSLLTTETSQVTDDECDEYECVFPYYFCSVVPSEWSNATVADAEEDDGAEFGSLLSAWFYPLLLYLSLFY